MTLKMNTFTLFIFLSLWGVIGCGSFPSQNNDFKFTKDTLSLRQIQTRLFQPNKEAMSDLISASIGVLQDLGYNIDSSEVALGLVVGSKRRTAMEDIDVAITVLSLVSNILSIFSSQEPEEPPTVDDEQLIQVSIFVSPVHRKSEEQLPSKPLPLTPKPSYSVRVSFQRTVWNNKGRISKQEPIDDSKIYESFFGKLSKSIFFEAHKI